MTELNSQIDLINYKNSILNKIRTAGSDYTIDTGHDIKTIDDLHKLVSDSTYFYIQTIISDTNNSQTNTRKLTK